MEEWCDAAVAPKTIDFAKMDTTMNKQGPVRGCARNMHTIQIKAGTAKESSSVWAKMKALPTRIGGKA
jgi:hypothetical protein